MLDRMVLSASRGAQQVLARHLVRWGVSANALSLAALLMGLLAAAAVVADQLALALGLLLVSRLLDGLDGTVARLTQATDRGAFIDIAFDFVFYALFALAFALRNPVEHALPVAVLLAAFVGTGSSFLALASLAAKRGLHNPDYPNKGLYFLGGLTEGTETIICFVLMCIWPAKLSWWAYGFALLCGMTTLMRWWWGWQVLQDVETHESEV